MFCLRGGQEKKDKNPQGADKKRKGKKRRASYARRGKSRGVTKTSKNRKSFPGLELAGMEKRGGGRFGLKMRGITRS